MPLPPTPAQQQQQQALLVLQAQAQALLAQQAQAHAIQAAQAQVLQQAQAAQAQAAQGQMAYFPWAPGVQPQAVSPAGWDQQSLTVSLNQPATTDWFFDSGATSHMTSDSSTLTHNFLSRYHSSIVVGNGSLLPVTSTGTVTLPGSFSLNNVLVSPSLIKNLISVRQFTSDNNCFVEFDPAGCSVKDRESRRVLVRCNSAGPLYPLRLPPAGHPGHEVMAKLASIIPSCNKELSKSLCHACQLGPINSIHYFPAISIAYIDHPPSSSSTDNFSTLSAE